MARFDARSPARRITLLLSLACLGLVLLAAAAPASASDNFAELEDDAEPVLFGVEAEDEQAQLDLADSDSDEDLVEDGRWIRRESAAVQKMKQPDRHPHAAAAAAGRPKVRDSFFNNPQMQQASRNRPMSLRQLPVRRRTADAGCAANPSICLDPSYYPEGPTCCGSKCVNTEYDSNNCGFCDNVCPFGTSCCIGLCIDTQTDSSNCGSCGNVCPVGNTCAFGFCGYGFS